MKKSLIRNIIIGAVVLILGFTGYKLFFGKKAAPASGLQTTTNTGDTSTTTTPGGGTVTTEAVQGSQDLLTQLSDVKSITLDDKFLQDKAFLSLVDFNHDLPKDDDPGRPNPFAPIGSNSTVVITQIRTSSVSSVTSTTSVLNGALTVSDPTASRWFEYGTTPAFGTKTPPTSQTGPGAFQELITKLTPNTTYYVKAVAQISGITISGNTVTWVTSAGAKGSGIPGLQ